MNSQAWGRRLLCCAWCNALRAESCPRISEKGISDGNLLGDGTGFCFPDHPLLEILAAQFRGIGVVNIFVLLGLHFLPTSLAFALLLKFPQFSASVACHRF